MANERLYQFPSKADPVPADLIFAADSADADNEVNITIAALIGAYPNLSGIARLTLGANTYAYVNNSAAFVAGSITTLAVSLLADSSISAMQSTLGYTATPGASKFAGWDANVNLSANSFLSAYTTTPTAAATTTLLVGSTYQQFFTGTTTQIIVLPVVSTLRLGQAFYIVNNSTGVVTVESSGGNTIQAMASLTTLLVTCIALTGTTAASWYADYNFQTEINLPLSLANGGTNANNTASAGGIIWSDATKFNVLAGTSTASQVLLSGNAATPTWSSATYPSTTTINQILYSPSANVIGGISSVNSAVMSSSSGGVPSFSTTLPSGIAATNFTMTTPILGTPQSGTLTNCTGLPSGTGITCTATNDNASAGQLGEYIAVSQITPQSLSNGVSLNIVSISLTAGDWDVWGAVAFAGNAATNLAYALASISITSATLDPNFNYEFSTGAGGLVNCNPASPVPTIRITLASTTTAYLVAQAGFSLNTYSATAFIAARRAR